MKDDAFQATEELATKIKSKIKGSAVIVGIGNPLRGDDGFGPRVIESLKGKVGAALFDCGTAPENYIIPILNRSPGTVIFLDAADFGGRTGEIGVFEFSEISNVGFSTHNTSLSLLADLFRTGDSDLRMFIVAAQPGDISFGSPLGDEVKSAIERLTGILASALA